MIGSTGTAYAVKSGGKNVTGTGSSSTGHSEYKSVKNTDYRISGSAPKLKSKTTISHGDREEHGGHEGWNKNWKDSIDIIPLFLFF